MRGGGGVVIITNLEIITIMCKISTNYGVNSLTGAGGVIWDIFFLFHFSSVFLFFFIFQFLFFIFFVEVVLNVSVWVVYQVGTREWWSLCECVKVSE